jgi:hypothetical protein
MLLLRDHHADLGILKRYTPESDITMGKASAFEGEFARSARSFR